MSEVKTIGEHKTSWVTIFSDEYESMKSTLEIMNDCWSRLRKAKTGILVKPH